MGNAYVAANVVVVGLLVAGCAGTSSPDPAMEATLAGPPPNVSFYSVAPPGAVPLGRFKVTVCNGYRDIVRRRILEEVARMGGNGVTDLTCRNEGMSWSCGSQPTCEGSAVNVLPPAPPPPPPRRRVKRG